MNELTELEKIEQILGKALGYPWYKDDPDIFPKATEADGVCVGIETAWSLAMIAADKIKELDTNSKEVTYAIESHSESGGWFVWTNVYSCSGKQETLSDLKSLLNTYRKNEPTKKFRLTKLEVID